MYWESRDEVASLMRRLYQQGLTTTSGGNISLRVARNRVLLTASATDKGTMQGKDVGVLQLDGTNLTPDLKPSIEGEMHLEIYRRHPSVTAVVHAHPVTACAFCATDRAVNTHLIGESYAILGNPVPVSYALMGSRQLAENVASALSKGGCLMMKNHGVLTTGTSLLQAFDKVEVLEAAAKLTILTAQIGGVQPLSDDQLAELDVLMGRRHAAE